MNENRNEKIEELRNKLTICYGNEGLEELKNAVNLLKSVNNAEEKKHVKGIDENKDIISDALYNNKPELLAKLYNDGILNDNDLKILSDSLGYKAEKKCRS